MPNLQAAKKALRVTQRQTEVNKKVRTKYRKARKAILDALTAGKVKEAKELLPKAYSEMDHAVKKNVLKKGTADRYKSRLAAAVKKADTSK